MDAAASFPPPDGAQKTADPRTHEILRVVASFLPPRVAPAARRFCDLAETASEVASDLSLSADLRTARLDAMMARLDGAPPEVPLAPALIQTLDAFMAAAAAGGGDPRHGHHMLQARRQDVSKHRYRDWHDLLAYARYAAAPYGRFALEVFGAGKAAQSAVEALCCALFMIAVVRDCARDYRLYGRVYLPERWFKDAGADIAGLGGDRADAALRQVFATALDTADRLLVSARPLPALLGDRRARGAAAALLWWANRLAGRLRAGDPLRGAIAPSRGDDAVARWWGRWRMVWR